MSDLYMMRSGRYGAGKARHPHEIVIKMTAPILEDQPHRCINS
jgi:hypothetical protein